MKKISTLALTAVLACGMAVPAMAQGDGSGAASSIGHGTQNAANATGANGTNLTNGANGGVGSRSTTNGGPTNLNGFGTNARGAHTGYGMDGVRMNNQSRAYNATTRTTAATNADDGVDWGWLGLAGLIGLAGLRGREKAK